MANSTDKSILTAAGKALLAQLNAEEKALVIDKMIFANVPNRPEYPQPDDVVPTDHIVHQEQVEQRGRLSADSVIYSTTLTSDVGPFEFNWTGAYCSEYGVLVTIDHHALTPKSADEPGVAGNTLVRSVVLEYKDIAEITNITVDASSWQYNATPRMKKMDYDVAQAIIDQNGKDWFIEHGFLVTPQASAFNIKAGAGYVSGNRVTLEFDRNVQVPNKPSFIYIDAHREGTPTGEQVTLFNFVVTTEEKDDYIDSSTGKDVKHFVCKIAQVLVDGSVSDLRPEGEQRKWVNGEVLTSSEADTFTIQLQASRESLIGKTVDGHSAIKIREKDTQQLWYAWGNLTGVVESFVENNDYGTATLVTDKGTYTLLTPKIFDYRNKRNCLGWGVIGDGNAIQEAIYDVKDLERPFVIVPDFFTGWTFKKILRLECEIKPESGKPLLSFDFDGPSLYLVKQTACVDFKDFKISGAGNPTVQSGVWLDLNSFAPVRKITIDVDVRDISNSNDTQACHGIIVVAYSDNAYDKYEIDIVSSVKRITATSPGVTGIAGSAKGILVSINKAGMTNNIQSIGSFVESVYPVQDGDGIHFTVVDHTDKNQRSTYSIKKPVVKDCAKRCIKNQAPNCTIEAPWMDTTLADGGMTTIAFDNYGVNCTLSKPMLRNFSDAGSGDGIRSNGENFVCTSINANVKQGRNLFRIHGGTYDIKGGVITVEEAYSADNAAVALIEPGCEGVLELPKVKGTSDTGTAVSYQGASGKHTLIVSRADGMNNLIRVHYGDPEITIESLIGSCKNEAIYTLGDEGEIKLRGSDVKAGNTGMNISKLFEITGSNKLECGVNGILVPHPIDGSYIDGDVNIKATQGGGKAIVVNGLRNGLVRGVKSENFATHISAKLSKSTILANNVARGGGLNIDDTDSTGNVKEGNIEVEISQ